MTYNSWKKKIKEHFIEVLHTKHSPLAIAWGFAIGTLIAILPTPGIGILLGTVTVLVFKKISKIALFGAMLMWNPFVLAPLYYASYSLGASLTGSSQISESAFLPSRVWSQEFFIGNAVLAASIAIVSFFIVYAWMSYRRKKSSNK